MSTGLAGDCWHTGCTGAVHVQHSYTPSQSRTQETSLKDGTTASPSLHHSNRWLWVLGRFLCHDISQVRWWSCSLVTSHFSLPGIFSQRKTDKTTCSHIMHTLPSERDQHYTAKQTASNSVPVSAEISSSVPGLLVKVFQVEKSSIVQSPWINHLSYIVQVKGTDWLTMNTGLETLSDISDSFFHKHTQHMYIYNTYL